jgi:hypothetical protein
VTGGGLLPQFVFNLMPTAGALFLLFRESVERARARAKASAGG